MMRLLALLTLLTAVSCGHQVSEEDQKKFQATFRNITEGVSGWITKHALYPESYEPISFSEFSQSGSIRHGEKIPGSEKYVIRHEHKILDKDSNLVTFSGYFILENDFDVNIIEVERSNSIGGAFPPQTQVWMEQFGRPLHAQDSLELDQKQKVVMDKFVKEMKDGLNKGDLETENPEDLDKLKSLIDTLEKKK